MKSDIALLNEIKSANPSTRFYISDYPEIKDFILRGYITGKKNTGKSYYSKVKLTPLGLSKASDSANIYQYIVRLFNILIVLGKTFSALNVFFSFSNFIKY